VLILNRKFSKVELKITDMKTFIRFTLIVIFVAMAASTSAQPLEYGDAPETVIAYPSTGVIGMFPTCINAGSAGFVQHNNFGAVLGPAFDFEIEGNAGLCPNFAPYDNDECFADGDAGLLFPEPYTIVNNVVVSCPFSTGSPLGTPCVLATWGGNVDITVGNNMPNQTTGYMNVVIDFNQNGVWGDIVNCPQGPVPEHILQNFVVPWGYTGPLSGLGPPAFTIGPNSGYVWARFTITEQPVGINWDGHGSFEDGESEDYLLEIQPDDQSDFGDAPEDVLAYPSTGVVGAFPTCIGIGAYGYVEHLNFGADLGPSIDYEQDGNAGLCPSFAPYDDDECFAGGDAGLTMPEPYTIINGLVALCPNSNGTSLGFPCDTAIWGGHVDIDVNNFMPNQGDAFMNVLIDWNRDGDWGDTVYCDTILVEEHVLQNFIVPPGYTGPLSGLFPAHFIIGPDHGFFWARFTISEVPVMVPWNGEGYFEDGETEDYLLHVDTLTSVFDYEYGDAPDGVMAYPSNGVLGNFPTCMNVPASGYIQHMNFGANLGPSIDFEIEGNAGLCPAFTPYDNDDCFNDGDAGLLFPDPYTIQGGVVVPCAGSAGTILGNTCTHAIWGNHIDMHVENQMPNQTIGYFNVLFDWNMNGVWGDIVQCPGSPAPEHVVQNFIIPNGFSGPVSGLIPNNFLIGPNGGHVWARFTISEAPVPVNWDGQGIFEDGETEDYLINIHAPPTDSEYGDAPEGMGAYPPSGIAGSFPTCIGSGPPNHFVSHQYEELIYWGPSKDFEPDGNAGICSPYAIPYDNDECFQDNDAGLIIPPPYTVNFISGNYVIAPCLAGNAGILDSICNMVHWGSEIDIDVTNLDTIDAVANILMDFNRNGMWDHDPTMLCSGTPINEHVLVNFIVPSGYSGLLSALNPPPFQAGPNVGYIWTRFTISESYIPLHWDGSHLFEKGESEDYILYVDIMPGIGDIDMFRKNLDMQIFPNPSHNSCTISYNLPADFRVEIEVFDIRGNTINTLINSHQYQGTHEVIWDGSNSNGHDVGSGIYFVSITIDDTPVQHGKVLMNK